MFDHFGPDKIPPILMGRHLIAIGLTPGKEFSKIMEAAYRFQIDKGITDYQELRKRALESVDSKNRLS